MYEVIYINKMIKSYYNSCIIVLFDELSASEALLAIITD